LIDHTGIGVSDVAAAATFYDAALGTLGMRRVIEMPEGAGSDGIGYGVEYPIFWIDRFHPHSTRQHTAFAASSREAVDAFHRAALGAGGRNNGPPGLRENQSTSVYYAAFVFDPDGNNIEVVFRNL
jgi:catechol 2,3-dioxygenase-like lactoylglutathione lyase family enzyme